MPNDLEKHTPESINSSQNLESAHSKLKQVPKAYTHLTLPLQDQPYDFPTLFGNDHPVELEVGIGKGRFLIERAKTHPNLNFIGIEWANFYYVLATSRAGRQKISNIRFLRDDAKHTFEKALGNRCLQGIHVYFPDPWPKKRHKKRRLIQTSFLDQVLRVLHPQGFLSLVTDHADYFQHMKTVINKHPAFEIAEESVAKEIQEAETNYHLKFREEGRTIHSIRTLIRN